MIILGALILAAVILGIVLWLLLTRRLREKYAALWILIGVLVLLVGAVPHLLGWLTAALGVQLPANLLFAMALVLLLGVTLHLSWELSQAEEEIRRVAEEAAISRTTVDDLTRRVEFLETDRLGDDED